MKALEFDGEMIRETEKAQLWAIKYFFLSGGLAQEATLDCWLPKSAIIASTEDSIIVSEWIASAKGMKSDKSAEFGEKLVEIDEETIPAEYAGKELAIGYFDAKPSQFGERAYVALFIKEGNNWLHVKNFGKPIAKPSMLSKRMPKLISEANRIAAKLNLANLDRFLAHPNGF